MKTASHSSPGRTAKLAAITEKVLLTLAWGGAVASLQAQSIIASGEVSGVQSSPGVYHYTLTISESSATTTPIESLWYGWVPGGFFLPSTPTSASGPTGWSASIVANSIQFSSGSLATDIAPGTSQTFDYFANFSPEQLAAAPNSGLTVAYAGAVDASTPNETFTVQGVPEPSTPAVFMLGIIGLGLRGWRMRVTKPAESLSGT
jgi:hypothetical protein